MGNPELLHFFGLFAVLELFLLFLFVFEHILEALVVFAFAHDARFLLAADVPLHLLLLLLLSETDPIAHQLKLVL